MFVPFAEMDWRGMPAEFGLPVSDVVLKGAKTVVPSAVTPTSIGWTFM
jgi:hypothetical protein